MKKNVLKLNLFLAFCLLVCAVVFSGNVSVSAAENKNETLAELIAKLPKVEVSGASYYFYNQLTDAEKAIFWELQEATWDSPNITLYGVENYTNDELYSMQNRAMTALIADLPMTTLYWKDYNDVVLSEDGKTYTITLQAHDITSDYITEKSKARIEQLVAMIGTEGDRYTKVRELFEWLEKETQYSPYFVFDTGIMGDVYDCSPMGIFINNMAICSGYSDAVKILCDELDIPCIIVGNAGHAWNMIQMEDGKWYLVDGTVFGFDYQLIGNTSGEYTGNSNYSISDMYLRNEGDFNFPELSENTYVYAGEYTPVYHDVESTFVEPAPTFVYKVNEDGKTCTIIEYRGKEEGDLTIPSKIDGYTVTTIGNSVFFACRGFTGDLVIPDTVTVIEEGAFFYCDGLDGELKLSKNLEDIQRYAFVGCKNLKGTLNLSEKLEKIGEVAFYQCESLTGNLILPNNIKEIGNQAFYMCIGLGGTFYLPDGLEWANGLISGTNLSEIQVSNTNTLYKVNDGVLYSKNMKTLIACAPGKIGSLIVPDGVQEIAEQACYQCSSLNGELSLPSSLMTIGRFAFANTAFVGDLKIPDGITVIEDGTFSGAGFSGKLTLPNKLESIMSSAFFACGFVGDLIIPDSVTVIDEYAFCGVNFSGTLQMSKNIQRIGSYAISGIYSSSLDFSNSDVVLEQNALPGVWFSNYDCNCNEEYIIINYEPATEATSGYIKSYCPHCGGGKDRIIPPIVKYNMYVCGKQITTDNMSGAGWKVEIVDEDNYKLYLNNAKLGSANSNSIRCDVDNLEIVLTGDNVINLDISKQPEYVGISANNITFSGTGTLILNCSKGSFSQNSSCQECNLIAGKDICIEDNVKIYIEGGTITGEGNAYCNYSDVKCENLMLGKNSALVVNGTQVSNNKAVSSGCTLYYAGVEVDGGITVNENGSLIVNGRACKNLKGVIGIAACNIAVKKNSIIYGNVYNTEIEESIGVYVTDTIAIDNEALIKGYGKKVGIAVESKGAIPNMPVAGGDTENTFNSLVVVEKEATENTVAYKTFADSTGKLAKYAQIGSKATITLSANGGTVSEASVTRYKGEKLGSLPTSSRTGYTFLGWYTSATGGSKVTSETAVTQNMTLYAQWKRITYIITFNANGGKVGTTKKTVNYGSTFGTLPTPTRTGYTFLGWYTAKTGGTKVTSATKATKSMTLYAQWKRITYTITFNANGGKVGTTKKTVNYGSTFGTLPTPSRTGYTFLGWYTEKTGGIKVTSTTKAVRSRTLYARWQVTKPSAVKGFTFRSRTASEIALKWTKNTSATGYVIQQYKNGKWVKIKTITKNTTVTYKVTGLKAGTTYKFKIIPYKTVDGVKVNGTGTTKSVMTWPSTVKSFTYSARTSKTITLKWAKNTSAAGYVIEQYKGGKWVKIKTITKNSTVSYKVTGLKTKTTYKFRIRAYKNDGSKNVYSPSYTTKSVKTL